MATLFHISGDSMTGRDVPLGMGREQKRATSRMDAKRERDSKTLADDPGRGTARPIAGNRLETPDETARRIYRTGGKPKRRAKTTHRSNEKPLKWREGRQ